MSLLKSKGDYGWVYVCYVVFLAWDIYSNLRTHPATHNHRVVFCGITVAVIAYLGVRLALLMNRTALRLEQAVIVLTMLICVFSLIKVLLYLGLPWGAMRVSSYAIVGTESLAAVLASARMFQVIVSGIHEPERT